ncbi:MAG: type II toxin-antitoxin system RelE/ParE family toxin [Nanoarchaeota archaeon]|nr:type II toxin-antitoxin system RelE/ParE family toxin [Nanoarchaeota archaeon]
MYALAIKHNVDRKFSKLYKKDQKRYEQIMKKIEEILNNPHHFKPLRAPMQNLREAHIGSFVLTYSINENNKVVTIEDYDHHDRIFIK